MSEQMSDTRPGIDGCPSDHRPILAGYDLSNFVEKNPPIIVGYPPMPGGLVSDVTRMSRTSQRHREKITPR